MPTKITALSKAVECADIGCSPTHHVIQAYHVDLLNKQSLATMASFMRAGVPKPACHITVQLPGIPPDGADAVQWIYAQLLAVDTAQNVLAGAEPVAGAAGGVV